MAVRRAGAAGVVEQGKAVRRGWSPAAAGPPPDRRPVPLRGGLPPLRSSK